MRRVRLIVLMISGVITSYAQGDTIHVNGRVIRFGHDYEERIYIATDSRIKEDFKKKIIVNQKRPVELDGERIFFDSTNSAIKNGQKLFESFMRILEPEIKRLPDGNYDLELPQIILDAGGLVVYFDTVYNCELRPRNYSTKIPVDISRSVMRKMVSELNTVKLMPAKYKGKALPSLILNPFETKTIFVKQGVITVY